MQPTDRMPDGWPRALLRALARRFNRPRASDLALVAVLWLIALAAGLACVALLATPALSAPLSEGDRVNLVIVDGADFAGRYQINVRGEIELPHVGPVRVAGADPAAAAQRIAETLVERRMFRSGHAQVSLQVLEWAPVDVTVEGAVHQPGRVRLNMPPGRDRAPATTEELPGARLHQRRLSDALRGAGGVRPTADLAAVVIERGNRRSRHDLTGVLAGGPIDDAELVSGDRVIVADTGRVDPMLVRPSPLTPPGIRVFVSNLTSPASSNNAATVDHGTVSMPYGSRLSQAVIAANCSGGTSGTNAGRRVVLVRTDRVSGRTERWERDIEALMQASDHDSNPLLAEGDGVACYDSAVTTLRDVFRFIADLLLPFRRLH